MSEESDREKGKILNDSNFNSDSDCYDSLKKSKTLLSEDSGIGIVSALSPDEENPYLSNGVNFSRLTRSTGIHSGLSDRAKENATVQQPDRGAQKFNSAFSQYLAMAKKLQNSPLDSSGSTSSSDDDDDDDDDDCFLDENDEETSRVEDFHLNVKEINENLENHKTETEKENSCADHKREIIKFHRGLRCSDAESAVKILKTRYQLADINLRKYHTKLVNPCNPILTTSFADSSFWKPVEMETIATKALREIHAEIEQKNKEISELLRLILKRQQTLMENDLVLEVKRRKENDEVDEKKPARNEERPKKIKSTKNPFQRAFHSMKKKFTRQDKMRCV